METTVGPKMAPSRVSALVKYKKSTREMVTLGLMMALASQMFETYAESKRRRWWVRPFLRLRKNYADDQDAIPNLLKEDPEYYISTFNVSPVLFEYLLKLVGPLIVKKDIIRDPIPPLDRLQMTLAFLVSGDQQKSIAEKFRVGRSTLSHILAETTTAIYLALQRRYLVPLKEVPWLRIAEEYEDIWQFPHCVGAIDGRYFAFHAPPKNGSIFDKYKGIYSIVAMATCDAFYRFTTTTYASAGIESDGGVFPTSDLWKLIHESRLGLPPPAQISGTSQKLPYFLVADETFDLHENVMIPYSSDRLSSDQRVFNNRLNRARKTIENAFGILISRWGILQDTLHMDPEKAINCLNTCIVLHNFLMSNEEAKSFYCPAGYVDSEDSDSGLPCPGEWRKTVVNNVGLAPQNATMCSANAEKVRDAFKTYFTKTSDSGRHFGN